MNLPPLHQLSTGGAWLFPTPEQKKAREEKRLAEEKKRREDEERERKERRAIKKLKEEKCPSRDKPGWDQEDMENMTDDYKLPMMLLFKYKTREQFSDAEIKQYEKAYKKLKELCPVTAKELRYAELASRRNIHRVNTPEEDKERKELYLYLYGMEKVDK